jgi:ComF family protein
MRAGERAPSVEHAELSAEPGVSGPPRRPDPVTRSAAFGRQIAAAARTVADSAIAILLAPSCAACARNLEQPTRGVVCEDCWCAITPILPPVCDTCGDPLRSWRIISAESGRCGRCRQAGSHVVRARAIGAYEGSLRSIVHALKYDGRRSLARPLADMLAGCGSDVIHGAQFVVPVPLHRSKQQARGFNQAVDIARHLSLPTVLALERVRNTPSQTDLPAPQRHANVRGAFSLTRGTRLRGAVVVVVDDVSTTGATLEACAEVLLQGGAREVRALTVARVVSTRL